jgi:hypothetical protein
MPNTTVVQILPEFRDATPSDGDVREISLPSAYDGRQLISTHAVEVDVMMTGGVVKRRPALVYVFTP